MDRRSTGDKIVFGRRGQGKSDGRARREEGQTHSNHVAWLRQGMIIDIEACVEQLAHARFDDIRQLASDDHDRFFLRRGHS